MEDTTSLRIMLTINEFRKFNDEWEFSWTSSSPYHSKSNDKAESAVKIAKRLLKRSDDPYLELLEFRNTPTVEMTTSPMQILMNRRMRSLVSYMVIRLLC